MKVQIYSFICALRIINCCIMKLIGHANMEYVIIRLYTFNTVLKTENNLYIDTILAFVKVKNDSILDIYLFHLFLFSSLLIWTTKNFFTSIVLISKSISN